VLTCSRASNQPIDTRFKVTLKNNLSLSNYYTYCNVSTFYFLFFAARSLTSVLYKNDYQSSSSPQAGNYYNILTACRYHFSFFVSDNIHDNMLNCELNINLLTSCKLSPVRGASSISSSCFLVASNIDTISSWVLVFLQCHLLQRIQSLHNSLYVIPDGLYGKAFPL